MKTSVALFVDYENAPVTTLAGDLTKFAQNYGELVIQKAYATNWKRLLSAKTLLEASGFSLIDVLIPLKNSADLKCMFDCIDSVKCKASPDVFIFVTGDGDYAHIIRFLKSRKKQIIVFAQRGSNSKKLKELAHRFHFLDELPQLVLSGDSNA